MKISVVTVCYNAAAELEATIQSVLEQTHPDVEYIIIDGGSTDGSVDIIRRYASRLAFWVSEPDGGIYHAMNKGIAHATGAYINFMNAGDRFASPTVLATIAAASPTATILYGQSITSRNGGKNLTTTTPSPLWQMKRHGVFCHQAAFIKTSYHQEHPFDTSYRSLADYDFFRRAYCEHNQRFDYINLPICIYNIDEGVSRNIDQNYRELHRILQTRRHPLLWLRLVLKKQYIKYLMSRGKY